MILEDRFWSKVNRNSPDECWLWIASLDAYGYGQFYMKTDSGRARPHKAHRIAYEWLVGDIPDGLEPDHLCRQTNCVNPRHLELVTHQENIARAFQRRGFLCMHPYTEENIYVRPSTGHRRCRICKSDQEKRARR